MEREIVITGFGVLSAFGFGADALRKNVFAGVPGFRNVTRFDSRPYRSQVAAESDHGTRQSEVFLTCARAALGMAGLEGPLVGSVLVGTQGDFTELHAFWKMRSRDGNAVGADTLLESSAAYLAGSLSRALQLRGRSIAFNNGCVAASNAIIHGCELLVSGREELVLCGGCYLVDEEFFAKFDSGRAFSRDGRLRAFSAERSGLLLGDGAAMLVLEEKQHAQRRGARCLAKVAGWGMASDAYHVCQPQPEGNGMADAITRALLRADVGPAEVGYINAHGTGTRLNDAAETKALKQALGGTAHHVPVSSTKTSTGHTLEASGALETVISLLALKEGLLPPTCGFRRPDRDCDLDYVPNEPRPARIHHVLNINAAFGGVNTALLLEKS